MATLSLKDKVSEDLSLRNMVSNIFKTAEFQKDEDVMIDFTGIKSISRSFAHEYLQHKEKQNRNVFEINMPSNIKKMFEIVENTKIKSELVKNSTPLEIGMC
jgi:hypothetical protein